jgi:hypothetical protein
MKKLLFLTSILLSLISNAQYSAKTNTESVRKTKENNEQENSRLLFIPFSKDKTLVLDTFGLAILKDSLTILNQKLKILSNELTNIDSNKNQKIKFFEEKKEELKLAIEKKTIRTLEEIRKIIADSVKKINDQKKEVLGNLSFSMMKKRDSIQNLNEKIGDLLDYKDDMEKLDRIIKHQKKLEDKNYAPFSKFADESEYFYEGNEYTSKLFTNSRITYSANTGSMSINSEAIHDYFGPVRVALSFTIATKKNVDSIAKNVKQDNTIVQLQNGGGDLSLNLHYPLFGSLLNNSNIIFKSSLYYNAGFSLPIFNGPTEDFMLTNDIGIDAFTSIQGFRNRIHFFGLLKMGYIFGNSDFRKAITKEDANNPNSFFIGQLSAGLDFNDSYRFQLDYYLGNSFVHKNFPLTVSFIIRPNAN